MLEGISLSFVALVVSTLGTPGLVIVLWYVDQRRTDRLMTEHKKEQLELLEELRTDRHQHEREMRDVLDAYREDVRKVTRMYEDNVLLVKGYERISAEHMDTIRLNTQTQAGLQTLLKERQPCHRILRQEMP